MVTSEYIFKKAKINNYDDYYKIRSEESNLFWTGYKEAPDYEKFKTWFVERVSDSKRDIYLMFFNKECVGSLHVDFEKKYIAIGYSVMKYYEGKGYGTLLVEEAVKIAKALILEGEKIDFVKAWINFQNIASIKVIEKCGFHFTENNEIRKRLGKEELYYEYALKL